MNEDSSNLRLITPSGRDLWLWRSFMMGKGEDIGESRLRTSSFTLEDP